LLDLKNEKALALQEEIDKKLYEEGLKRLRDR